MFKYNRKVDAMPAVMYCLLSITCTGCGHAQKETQEVTRPSTEKVLSSADTDAVADKTAIPGVELSLHVQGLNAEQKPTVVIKVRNSGKAAFVWDQDFTALLKWSVTMMDGTPLASIEEKPLTIDPDSTNARCIKLSPGEAVSKEVDLFGAVKLFSHVRMATAFNGELVVVPMGGETIGRFEIPEGASEVLVSAEYTGDDADAADGFAVYFKERPERVGLPQVRIRARNVKVVLQK